MTVVLIQGGFELAIENRCGASPEVMQRAKVMAEDDLCDYYTDIQCPGIICALYVDKDETGCVTLFMEGQADDQSGHNRLTPITASQAITL